MTCLWLLVNFAFAGSVEKLLQNSLPPSVPELWCGVWRPEYIAFVCLQKLIVRETERLS